MGVCANLLYVCVCANLRYVCVCKPTVCMCVCKPMVCVCVRVCVKAYYMFVCVFISFVVCFCCRYGIGGLTLFGQHSHLLDIQVLCVVYISITTDWSVDLQTELLK